MNSNIVSCPYWGEIAFVNYVIWNHQKIDYFIESKYFFKGYQIKQNKVCLRLCDSALPSKTVLHISLLIYSFLNSIFVRWDLYRKSCDIVPKFGARNNKSVGSCIRKFLKVQGYRFCNLEVQGYRFWNFLEVQGYRFWNFLEVQGYRFWNLADWNWIFI